MKVQASQWRIEGNRSAKAVDLRENAAVRPRPSGLLLNIIIVIAPLLRLHLYESSALFLVLCLASPLPFSPARSLLVD